MLAGAACIALASYIRLVGVLMLPGLFALALRRAGGSGAPRGWRLLPGLLALALAAPWLAWARLAASAASGPADQRLVFDYWTALTRADPGDPGSPWLSAAGLLERMGRNSAELFDLAQATLGIDGGWLGGIAVALALLGFARSLRAPSLLEWFAGSYLALLLVSGVHLRLGLPLVHLVPLHLLVAVRDLAAWLGRRRFGPELAWVPVAAGLASLNLSTWRETRPPLWPDERRRAKIEARWEAELQVAERIRARTPPQTVLLANDAPVLSVLAERRAYTYRFGKRTDLMRRYRPDLILVDVEEFSVSQFEEELRRVSRRRWKPSDELSRGRIAVYEAPLPRRKRPSP
jgi:hypothetical protein